MGCKKGIDLFFSNDIYDDKDHPFIISDIKLFKDSDGNVIGTMLRHSNGNLIKFYRRFDTPQNPILERNLDTAGTKNENTDGWK